MSLDEFTFVELIEKLPHLWDKKNNLYRDQIASENGWKSIAEIMQITVEECYDLWKSIRLKYVRENRKILYPPSGSGGVYRSNWALYDKLNFLNATIKTRRRLNVSRRSNITDPSDTWQSVNTDEDGVQMEEFIEFEESISEEKFVTEEEENQVDSSPVTSPLVSCKTPSIPRKSPSEMDTEIPSFKMEQIKKRKVDTPESLVLCSTVCKSTDSSIQSTNQSLINREDYYFGLSIAESLSRIRNNKKKLTIKARILMIIAEASD